MINDYASFLCNIINYIQREFLYQANFKREFRYPFYLGTSTNHRVKEENNIKRIIEHYYGPKISVVIERGKYRTLFIVRIEEEKNEETN